MERVPLYIKDNKRIVIDDNASINRFVIDLEKHHSHLDIDIPERRNIDVLFLNIHDGLELHFEVKDNSTVHFAILAENPAKTLNITANVGQNSVIDGYFADFINSDSKCEVLVNLNGEGSSVNWHLSSLADSNYRKEFSVSAIHKNIGTLSQLDNYGVCRDNAKLIFSGICQIDKGSHASKAHQNAKIMIFDEKSNGVAKPILKIDENDIEASHASVVGKINDEHLFYLTSRGLTEERAKQLITFGYLKPILKGFDDEEIIAHIEDKIEGKI